MLSSSSATLCEARIDARFRLLPGMPKPRWIVFCDFDETYFAHDRSAQNWKAKVRLEDYLTATCPSTGILFGLVTGSSLEEVLQQMGGSQMTLLPHFIASDLGTEITYFDQNVTCRPDWTWRDRMASSGFSKEAVRRMVEALRLKGVDLKPQPELRVAAYKKSYFLEGRDPEGDQKALSLIRELAAANALGLNISRCNPKAGDPEGSYDIDFIPVPSGKERVVQYLLSQNGLAAEDAYAFGESGNDIPMLKVVRHGFLVANATEEAKALHDQVTGEPYAGGILQVLEAAF
ncbi:HAD-IIB family hydrolase [Mesoterricola silvestris]|nr:HAD-IIB family hydrolase [Mesoterricola silvestris]